MAVAETAKLAVELSLDDTKFARSIGRIDRRLGAFSGAVNRNLAYNRSAKVLLFPDPRGYYLDVPYQWGSPIFQSVISYDQLSSAAALRQVLSEQKITHVLVSWDQMAECTPQSITLMKDLLTHDAEELLEQRPYAFYALKTTR